MAQPGCGTSLLGLALGGLERGGQLRGIALPATHRPYVHVGGGRGLAERGAAPAGRQQLGDDSRSILARLEQVGRGHVGFLVRPSCLTRSDKQFAPRATGLLVTGIRARLRRIRAHGDKHPVGNGRTSAAGVARCAVRFTAPDCARVGEAAGREILRASRQLSATISGRRSHGESSRFVPRPRRSAQDFTAGPELPALNSSRVRRVRFVISSLQAATLRHFTLRAATCKKRKYSPESSGGEYPLARSKSGGICRVSGGRRPPRKTPGSRRRSIASAQTVRTLGRSCTPFPRSETVPLHARIRYRSWRGPFRQERRPF